MMSRLTLSRSIPVTGLLGILLLTSACSTDLSPGFVPSSATDSTEIPSDGKQALGVKNYQQVFDTLLVLSNLIVNSTNNNNLLAYYNANRTTLSSDNSVERMLPNNINAATNLAYEFCEVLTTPNNQGNFPANFFTGTSFQTVNNNAAHNPTQLIVNLEKREELVEHLLNKFLAVAEGTAFRDEVKTEMMTLLGDISQGSPNTALGTQVLMRAACTVAATTAVSFL